MEKVILTAELRNASNDLRDVRGDRKVPAVVYGQGVENTSLMIDASPLLKAHRVTGTTELLDLVVDGKTHSVRMHEVQLHPISGEIQHVDFLIAA